MKYAANGEALAEYLAGRGLESLATSSSPWGLGLVVGPEPGHEHVTGRMSIPYLTRAGCVEIKFRCLRDHDCKAEKCPKYLYASGGEHRLFNANAFFQPSDVIAVVEGELDAVAVQHLTGVPAVGYPGTSGFQEFMARCFSGFARVLVVADGDEAGRAAAKSVAKEIGRFADSATVVRLPDGEDSNSYIHTFGVDAYRKVIGA
jgi:hypothetical protein